jgi:hypothetical protein
MRLRGCLAKTVIFAAGSFSLSAPPWRQERIYGLARAPANRARIPGVSRPAGPLRPPDGAAAGAREIRGNPADAASAQPK